MEVAVPVENIFWQWIRRLIIMERERKRPVVVRIVVENYDGAKSLSIVPDSPVATSGISKRFDSGTGINSQVGLPETVESDVNVGHANGAE
jgi:hypothetical protein